MTRRRVPPEARQTAQADDVIAGQARADWTERVGRRTGEAGGEAGALPKLPPPSGLRAQPGVGQVTLDWEYVEGAVGYLVHRAVSGDGPFEPLDHLGRDVLAVPHPPYADTTCKPGEQWWYAVAAVADVRSVGELSAPVAAGPFDAPQPGSVAAQGVTDAAETFSARELASAREPVSAQAIASAQERPGAPPARVAIEVDAGDVTGPLPRPWRPMIGSEHLSHLLNKDTTGGRPIGAELTEALRIVATELGVQTVRAHAILGDDLGVYRERDGQPVYDFTGVDRVYDLVLGIGLRPIVELSFMPRDLAADPSATVFAYGAIISPPKDWDRAGWLRRGPPATTTAG